MKKRDRGLTPTNTSLIAGWNEAVSREIIEVKPDTASEKADLDSRNTEGTISAIKTILIGRDIWKFEIERNQVERYCSAYTQQ